ncbi:MAG: substrate-binding domain-containing protein [Lachnospirales bacterium]
MKKILFLIFVLAFVLTACNGESSQVEDTGSEVIVGYSSNNLNDTFQTYIIDAAEKKASEVGAKVEIQDAQEDVIRQQDQVKAMISQGVDVLIVVPVDTSAIEPITKAAATAEIPLIYVNRNPFSESDMPENVFYVGSQEFDAGMFQAEYLMELIEGGGVGILQGILTNEGAVERTRGNIETLADNSNFKILAEESGNWQRDQGITITENWITAYGDELKAVLANNDEMALGAVRALETAGRTDVIVMGVDGITDALLEVENGKLAATVLQDAVGQGSGAIEAAMNAVSGKEQDAITWVPFVLINKDNIAEYK